MMKYVYDNSLPNMAGFCFKFEFSLQILYFVKLDL